MSHDDPQILEGQRVLLKLQDPLDNTVYLFEPRWTAKIVLDHPVTLEDLRTTVTEPNVIQEFGGDRRYYRRLVGKAGYMFSVSKPYRGYNSIVTTYPVTHIQEWAGARFVYVRAR